MAQIKLINNIGKKTHTEQLINIEKIKYKKVPFFIRPFYNLIIYSKVNKCLCLEDQYALDGWVRHCGLERALKKALYDCEVELGSRELLKKLEMEKEASKRRREEAYYQKHKKDIDRETNIEGLTNIEIELRNKAYPGGYKIIPDEIIYSQRVLENGAEDEVTWIIFNKVYGCWAAAVTSPHRNKEDGSRGCVQIRETNLVDLKYQLMMEIVREKERQREFMAARSRKPNIQRAQGIMRPTNVDPQLNGDDIF